MRDKVLMTADTVGGVWTYALELSRALGDCGVEVLLATMGGPLSPGQAAEAAEIPGLRIEQSAYKLEWMEEPWADVAAAGEWLLGLAADWRPAVVHLNGYAHAALGWPAPVLVVAHSCVLSWHRAVQGRPAPPEWDRYRAAVGGGLAAADRIVAPSAAMRGELEACYGPMGSCAVIHNGRTTDLLRPLHKEPLIMAAGRLWDAAKNLAALDAAAADLPWPVVVAGSARHPDGGAAAAAHARLLGQLPFAELAGWLGRAAIYALPARYEPFGLSALEAALAGCALVLGDIPSLREIWGDTALYAPPGDHRALRDCLIGLIEDPVLRTSMAHRSLARASVFTAERMADAYRGQYRDLAGRPLGDGLLERALGEPPPV